MRFLVDAQLPLALARRLAEHGHQATHVIDHDMVSASDDAIWPFAGLVEAVIITKDEDFAARKFRMPTGPRSYGCACPTGSDERCLNVSTK